MLKLLCVVLCPSDSQHQLGGVDAGSRWWRCVRRGRSFEADTFHRAREGRCVSFVAGEKKIRYFSISVCILPSVAAAVLSLTSWPRYTHSYLQSLHHQGI